MRNKQGRKGGRGGRNGRFEEEPSCETEVGNDVFFAGTTNRRLIQDWKKKNSRAEKILLHPHKKHLPIGLCVTSRAMLCLRVRPWTTSAFLLLCAHVLSMCCVCVFVVLFLVVVASSVDSLVPVVVGRAVCGWVVGGRVSTGGCHRGLSHKKANLDPTMFPAHKRFWDLEPKDLKTNPDSGLFMPGAEYRNNKPGNLDMPHMDNYMQPIFSSPSSPMELGTNSIIHNLFTS